MFQCQFRIHSTKLVDRKNHISQERKLITGYMFKQGAATNQMLTNVYLSINFQKNIGEILIIHLITGSNALSDNTHFMKIFLLPWPFKGILSLGA